LLMTINKSNQEDEEKPMHGYFIFVFYVQMMLQRI